MPDSPLSSTAPASSEAPLSKRLACLAGDPPQQIGILVRDLDASLRMYSDVLGMGPWVCFTHSPETVPRMEYRGQPAAFSMRVALAEAHPQMELIQPLAGPSIYFDWMERHGEGIHHIAYEIASIDEGIAQMTALGYPMIQYGAGFGLDGDGAFAYFDTEADFAVVMELRVAPRRRSPEATAVNR